MFKNIKKLTVATMAILTLSSAANAGVLLDLRAGAGVWSTAPSGEINYGSGSSTIDLEDTLGLEKSSNVYFYADINHFVPLIPNVRLEQQNLKIDATKTTTLTFGSLTTNADSTATTLDLKQTDIIAYWSVPGLNLLTAGIVDVNFGLDFKKFDGGVALNNEEAIVDFALPMGYLAARVKVPFAPLEVFASHKTIAYSGSSLNDQTIMASFTFFTIPALLDFKIDVGYKKQSLVLDKDLTDTLEADIEFSGPVFGLSAKF